MNSNAREVSAINDNTGERRPRRRQQGGSSSGAHGSEVGASEVEHDSGQTQQTVSVAPVPRGPNNEAHTTTGADRLAAGHDEAADWLQCKRAKRRFISSAEHSFRIQVRHFSASVNQFSSSSSSSSGSGSSGGSASGGGGGGTSGSGSATSECGREGAAKNSNRVKPRESNNRALDDEARAAFEPTSAGREVLQCASEREGATTSSGVGGGGGGGSSSGSALLSSQARPALTGVGGVRCVISAQQRQSDSILGPRASSESSGNDQNSERQQQQQQQQQHGAPISNEGQTTTTSHELNNLIDSHEANPTFWARLSNLSRSIIHQQQQALRAEESARVAEQDEHEARGQQQQPTGTFLAPEVVGYLESKKQERQKQLNSTTTTTTRRANVDTAGCNLLLLQSHSRREGAQRTQVEFEAAPSDPSEGSSMTGAAESMGPLGLENSEQLAGGEEETERMSGRRKSQQGPTGATGKRQNRRQTQAQQVNVVEVSGPGGQRVIKIVDNNLHRVEPQLVSARMFEQQKHQIEQVAFEGRRREAAQLPVANKQQVKSSITTNATTTNTTSTTTRSSSTDSTGSSGGGLAPRGGGTGPDGGEDRGSVSSLSSCILSETSTARSDEEVRLKWDKKMDFLLSIIGFAVDLANIWRFPYLVYKNGGGVFLIPYLTMLIFGGIPLFFLELCLGQFVKKGPITLWNKICPYMKGVGYCSILISWYVSFYYNVLIAWSVYFIYRSIMSIGDKMPWEDCDNKWNTNTTCLSITQLKNLCAERQNVTLEQCRKDMFSAINVTSPASEFFVKELSQIDQSTGLDDMGYLRTELVICTMIVYLLHYFSLFRGLETSGKVVWVTATAPYMILSILLVRGLFLPGASMGIEYYLSPRLEKLADPQVWIDAAGQVFYSIGVGFGVHLTYASFNSHDNNCYRDCLMTSAVNALTSVYSGLVVFVYLGYMATNLGIEIDKVASEGYSLVFEVYPEALTTLPFARFWSILFFIMLLTLGIDSAMGGLEAVITGLEDEFRFAKRLSRGQLTGLVIVSSFLPALISCTQGGAYTLFWFDIYSAGVSLLFSALFETIGVVYCYGLDKFILNIESMLGKKPQLFYILCWKYISPIFLMGIIFMSIYTASVPVYRGYTFPLWSIILGWCLAFSSVAAVPIVALWTWCSNGSKAISVSPSKSPRKPASGSESRNASRKSALSQLQHQDQCKSMTVVNYSGAGQPTMSTGGLVVASGHQMTTTTTTSTSNVINLPPDHHHHYETTAFGSAREEMV